MKRRLIKCLLQNLRLLRRLFFAQERASVVIETHWLGGRHMWGRWEIADIALIILLRSSGRLEQRKVALLQTKRLYSKEISVEPLTRADYLIGIGRLGDRTDQTVPLTRQRKFSFNRNCVYGAMAAESEQVEHIESYEEKHSIPVFYGFYNPMQMPSQMLYPALNGEQTTLENALGCRVKTSADVHKSLASLGKGMSPDFKTLKGTVTSSASDPFGLWGWRLETFVADEVLRCRQGALFGNGQDINLEALFYRRTAPITAAIAITVEIGRSD
jgi:hypothetical protein